MRWVAGDGWPEGKEVREMGSLGLRVCVWEEKIIMRMMVMVVSLCWKKMEPRKK